MVAHAALMLMIYAVGLLVFQRPWFAAVQMLIWQCVIIAVSYVKHRSLREVFLFQDFEYFSDMVRHPRLYIPFFGVGNIFLIALASATLILAALVLETGLPGRIGTAPFILTSVGIGLVGWLLLQFTRCLDFAASFDPTTDLHALGLFGSFVAYARAEKRSAQLPQRFASAPEFGQDPPHLVVIQSESFFDARRVHPDIHPDVYAWLDDAHAQAVQHGTLHVPCWGANTVRSEFAFLSGLRPEQLGVHRFNPYRCLGEVSSLAHALKAAGYRTVCVHPYMPGFYGRDRVLPRLGFDDFIDISAFGPGDYSGPYIGDQAVADKVAMLLQTSGEPLFVFVITMENHGPLHLEKVTPGEIEQLYAAHPPTGFDDLTIYLRHIRNAGAMQRKLCRTMQALEREAWLCWYGDHVPILPKVYAQATFTDGRSDYFIWHSRQGPSSVKQEIDIADLGDLLLRHSTGQAC
jgi:phosphoglycerol transferase MdoB-like AlkP superfamily enzyme